MILGSGVAVASGCFVYILCLVVGLLPSSVLGVLLFAFWWFVLICFGVCLWCMVFCGLPVWAGVGLWICGLVGYCAFVLLCCLLRYLYLVLSGCLFVCGVMRFVVLGLWVNSVVVVVIVWFVLYAGGDLWCCSWGLVVCCFGWFDLVFHGYDCGWVQV